jgi:hypothetical protein
MLSMTADEPMAAAAAAATAWAEPIHFDRFPREEIEAAFWEYVKRANANDWDAWVDLFTEDVVYVDHYFGVMRGRERVREWMVPLMAGQPELKFPVGFHAIVGDVILNYNWNRWPNPDGSFEPYDKTPNPSVPLDSWPFQFPCMTIDRYAGDGKWRYEENLYSAPAYLGILTSWQGASGAA